MTPRAFQIHASDNVATLLDEATSDATIQVLNGPRPRELKTNQSIAQGHKIALADIASGSPIRKFGVIIGLAISDIRPGQWVHLHNCKSQFDERSGTLDVHSGATTDTKYE